MQNYILIATLRSNLKISQVDMAKILKINIRNYKMYESGKRIINLEDLNKISNYFNVSLNALLNMTDNPKSYNNHKDINYIFLAFNIKLLRIKNNLTQKDLAIIMDTNNKTISKYENDSHNINVAYLKKLALKYHLSIDYICGKTLKKEV